MALNTRNIDLYHHNNNDGSDAYVRVRSVLLNEWTTGDNLPFQKVKALTFLGPGAENFFTPILPTMASLEVRDTYLKESYDRTLLTEPLPMPAQPLLKRLVFANCNLSVGVLRRMVRSKSLCNLKELIVDGPRQINTPCNLDSLIRTLDIRTPDLESLRWTDQAVGDDLCDNPDKYPQFS
jgi:hypothetical protein